MEIGGNTGPLTSALKDVNKSASSVQSELKNVNKQLKFNPSSTVLLKQKQELLAKQISNTKEKLETLKDAEKQAEQQFNNGEIGEEKYRALQREVEKTESQLKNLEKQAREASSVLGTQLQEAGKKISAAGEKVSNVGQKFAPASAAAAGLGVAAVKMADDFQESGSKVSTIADTSQESMSKLESGVLELSNETGESADDLNEALYQTISAGVKTGDAVQFLGTATKLAKGGFTDSQTAIDTLTTTINAYGLKASDATKISDQLIQTQNLGKTTVADLGQSLGNVIPIAASMNVKTTDLFGSVAELTKNGVQTSEAVTGLKSAFSTILKPTTAESEAAKQMGIDFSEAHLKNVGWPKFLEEIKEKTGGSSEKMAKLFGNVRALNAVTILAGKGNKDFNKTLTEMSKSAGSTDSAFSKMEDNGASKWEKAVNSIKNAVIKLGGALAPVAEKIASVISKIAKKLQALSPVQQKMIAKALLVTAAIAPLLITVGQTVSAVGNITKGTGKLITKVGTLHGWLAEKIPKALTFLSTHPTVIIIAAVIAAIAALVIGIKHLWDTNKKFRNAVKSIWGGIKNVFVGAVKAIKFAWNGITGFFSGIWSGIQSAATAAWNGIKSVVMAIITPFVAGIKNIFNGMKSGLSDILNGVKSIFSGVWTVIKNVVLGIVLVFIDLITGNFKKLHSDLSHILSNIKNAFKTIWGGIKSVVTGIVKAIVGAVIAMFKNMVTNLKELGNKLKTFFKTLWTGIKKTAVSVWTGLIKYIKSLPADFMNGVRLVGQAIIHGFDDAIAFIKSLPSKMLQWGKDMIQGLVDGIKSMIGKVTDAVRSVGRKIRSYLHFSRPDEGPLADYESWMPDMMEGLRAGMLNNLSKVQDAAQQVSTAIAATIPTDLTSNVQVRTAMAAAYGNYPEPAPRSGTGGTAGTTSNATGDVKVYQYFQGKVPTPAEYARQTRNGVREVIRKMRK